VLVGLTSCDLKVKYNWGKQPGLPTTALHAQEMSSQWRLSCRTYVVLEEEEKKNPAFANSKHWLALGIMFLIIPFSSFARCLLQQIGLRGFF
jgi:hypothetical protein